MRTGTAVTAVDNMPDGRVRVSAGGSAEQYDEYDSVVFATHSDITLKLLGEGATADEKKVGSSSLLLLVLQQGTARLRVKLTQRMLLAFVCYVSPCQGGSHCSAPATCHLLLVTAPPARAMRTTDTHRSTDVPHLLLPPPAAPPTCCCPHLHRSWAPSPTTRTTCTCTPTPP